MNKEIGFNKKQEFDSSYLESLSPGNVLNDIIFDESLYKAKVLKNFPLKKMIYINIKASWWRSYDVIVKYENPCFNLIK